MARRSVLRWIILTVLTLGLVASLGAMFVVRGAIDEVWVYASLALYGMALLVYWLISAGSKQPSTHGDRDEVAEKVARALAESQGPSTTTLSEPEPEIVVEPSRTEPIVLPTIVPTAPPAYQFRGYTLYARGGSRFFSKGTPPGAQAIELPPGYEAKWDDKKEKPVLIEVLEPESETPDVVLAVQQKPCSAMTSPGEFCDNLCADGSRFCDEHVDFSSEGELFEVRRSPTSAKGKAPKFAAPQIEIRQAKLSSKPLKFTAAKQSDIEVRVARPSNTRELEYKRGKPVEVKADKARMKAFRPRGAGEVVVQVAKPSNLKPIRLQKANEPIVRIGKPPEPKPLRLKTAREPTVRSDQATPIKAKGKGLAPSEIIVRSPSAPKAPAKGKQLAASEIVLKRPVVASAPKGKPLARSEIVVKKPSLERAPPKGKPLAPSQIVVKKPAPDKATPKGKTLAPSEIVVKRPGTATAKPLKFGVQDFEVRSTHETKASAKPLKSKEPEIVVVKDTKRRSMLGVEGEAPKKA